MKCRLCLDNTDDSIFIFSEEQIQKYIAKFLQLELSTEDPISKVICPQCWEQLDGFQKFCLKIEKAQKTLFSSSHQFSQNENINSNPYEHKFNQNEKVNSNADISSFELFNSEIGANVLKEENLERFDGNCDNDDTPFYLEDDSIKVELHNDEEHNASKPIITNSPETNVPIPIQRVTRRSLLKKLDHETLTEIKRKRKSSLPNKEEIVTHETTERTDDPEKEIESSNTNANLNLKRKRGRPRKGEVVIPKVKRPKSKTVRSEQCSKIFQTAREFDAIIQKHMKLSCDVCFIELVDFAELKRHFRAVHKCRGYAVCCKKKLFKRGLVVDHINVHNNPEHFKCTECGKVLADRMCLRNHNLLFHSTEELLTFQCTYCPEKFAKQYLLDHHSVKHIRKDKSKLLCPECGNGFINESSLTNHLNKVHSTDYDKICEICAKIVRGNSNFERHMKEHEGIFQPRVQCTVCGLWLKTKRILVKHMEKHDGKTYFCSVCGKHSASKSALQSHMNYVHDLARKHSCTLCDKAFKKALGLKEHMTTHTGEVLYTCPHCPITFNSRANMHSHRKKKHREEWEANRLKFKKNLIENPV